MNTNGFCDASKPSHTPDIVHSDRLAARQASVAGSINSPTY